MTMLTRGKLAAQTGCNIETIRYYEKVGIIPDPARTPAGYRVYNEEHINRLRFILRAKELGFSAERIRGGKPSSAGSGRLGGINTCIRALVWLERGTGTL